MAQVTGVSYPHGNYQFTFATPQDADQVFTALKGRYHELSNGTYQVVNGVLVASLNQGSKA